MVKVSIIISVYNGGKNIKNTIISILNQNYKNLELIVVDGGSNDNTIQIIQSFNSKKIKWISEPDKGISDAFNKGINLATGDYINFQGDGDGFIDNNSITQLFSDLDLSDKPIVCGNIKRISNNGELLYESKIEKKFNKKSLLFKMSLPHQGLFLPKEFFVKYGEFDLNNKYCMDYELLLRAYHNFPQVISKDLVVAYWRADGLGEGKTIEILKEYLNIKKKNKASNPIFLYVIFLFDIIKYFLRKLFYQM